MAISAQCGEESSLVPRMFVETIACTVWFVRFCLCSTSISKMASATAIKGTLADTLLKLSHLFSLKGICAHAWKMGLDTS